MKLKIIIIFSFFFIAINAKSQKSAVDSLLNLLSKEKNDTSKVNLLFEISTKLPIKENEKAIKYANEAVALAQKCNFLKGLAKAYKQLGIIYTMRGENEKAIQNFMSCFNANKEAGDTKEQGRAIMNIGIVYKNEGKTEKALEYYNQSLEIFTNSNDQEGIAKVYNNISNIYNLQGNYKPALDYLFKALTIFEKLNKPEDVANASFNIGSIYKIQAQYYDSKKYYLKALRNYTKVKKDKGIADVLNNLGALLYEQKKYDSALFYYDTSLILYSNLKLKPKMGLAFYNMGDVNNKIKNYDRALTYLNQSLKIREEIKDKKGIANCYNSIGENYFKRKEYTKSIEFLEKALKLSKEVGDIIIQKDAAEYLSQAYFEVKQLEKAYQISVLFKNLNDSIFKEDNNKTLTRIAMQYEFDKQQKAQEIKYEAEINQQKIFTRFAIVAASLLLIVVFVVFRSYQIKKKHNNELQILNAEIMQQKEEITAQRDEIEAQRDQIEAQRAQLEVQRDIAVKQRDEITQQKKEITDSIYYAKRIQTAVLPEREFFESFIPENFIIFKPRDIVSGDFYWFYKKENHIIFTAADCTGHGVPGAFMSLLGISFLNEVMSKIEYVNAGMILDMLRLTLIKALHQTGKFDEAKDGMDIAFCILNQNNYKLQFAGAYNPLLLVRKGNDIDSALKASFEMKNDDGCYLYELKPDRMPIGIYIKDKAFETKEIQAVKGDSLYIFSDGYIDQFGGPQGRKLRMQTLKEQILLNQNKNMHEQQEALEKFLELWQGNKSQLDDILVIGVKI